MGIFFDNGFEGTVGNDASTVSGMSSYNLGTATIKYSSTNVKTGSTSARALCGSGSTDGIGSYIGSSGGSTNTRAYYYITSISGNSGYVILCSTWIGAYAGTMIKSDGTWGCGYLYPGYPPTMVQSASGTIPFNEWIRIETEFNATTGVIIKIWTTSGSGVEATGTPDKTITFTGWAGSPDIGSFIPILAGKNALNGGGDDMASCDIYMDDVKYTDTGWIGPSGGGSQSLTKTIDTDAGTISNLIVPLYQTTDTNSGTTEAFSWHKPINEPCEGTNGTDASSLFPDSYSGTITYSNSKSCIGNTSVSMLGSPALGIIRTGSYTAAEQLAHYTRAYFYIQTLATNEYVLLLAKQVGWYTTGIAVKSDGSAWEVVNAYESFPISTQIWAAGTVPIGAWFRLEIYKTAGTWALRLYKGTDLYGSSPTSTANTTNVTGIGAATSVVYGSHTSSGIGGSSTQVYVDSIKTSLTDWVGPEAINHQASVSLSVTANIEAEKCELSLYNRYSLNNTIAKTSGSGPVTLTDSYHLSFGNSITPKEGTHYAIFDANQYASISNPTLNPTTNGFYVDFYYRITVNTAVNPLFVGQNEYGHGSGWFVGVDGSIGNASAIYTYNETAANWDNGQYARAPAGTIQVDTWYRVQVKWPASGNERVRVWDTDDRILADLTPGTSTFGSTFGLGVGYMKILATLQPYTGGYPIYIDDLYIGPWEAGPISRTNALLITHSAASSLSATIDKSVTANLSSTNSSAVTSTANIVASVSVTRSIDSAINIETPTTAAAYTGIVLTEINSNISVLADIGSGLSSITRTTAVSQIGTSSTIVSYATSSADPLGGYFEALCEGIPGLPPGELFEYSAPYPGTIEYSAEQSIVGSTSIKINDIGGGSSYLRKTSTWGSKSTYSRGYYYIDSTAFNNDSANNAFIHGIERGSSITYGLTVNKDGTWGQAAIVNQTGYLGSREPGTIPLNQWIRVEAHQNNTIIEYRIFYDTAGHSINDLSYNYVKKLILYAGGIGSKYTPIGPSVRDPLGFGGDLLAGTSRVYLDAYKIQDESTEWIGPYGTTIHSWTLDVEPVSVDIYINSAVDYPVYDLTPLLTAATAIGSATVNVPYTDRAYTITASNANMDLVPTLAVQCNMPSPANHNVPHWVSIEYTVQSGAGENYQYFATAGTIDLGYKFPISTYGDERLGKIYRPGAAPGNVSTINYTWDPVEKAWYTTSFTGPVVLTDHGPNEALDKWGPPLYFTPGWKAANPEDAELVTQQLHYLSARVKKELADKKVVISHGTMPYTTKSRFYRPGAVWSGTASGQASTTNVWSSGGSMIHEIGHIWDGYWGMPLAGWPNGKDAYYSFGNFNDEKFVTDTFNSIAPNPDNYYLTNRLEFTAQALEEYWIGGMPSQWDTAGSFGSAITPYGRSIGFLDVALYAEPEITIDVNASANIGKVGNAPISVETAIVSSINVERFVESSLTTTADTTSTGVHGKVVSTDSISSTIDVTSILGRLLSLSSDTTILAPTDSAVALTRVVSASQTSNIDITSSGVRIPVIDSSLEVLTPITVSASVDKLVISDLTVASTIHGSADTGTHKDIESAISSVADIETEAITNHNYGIGSEISSTVDIGSAAAISYQYDIESDTISTVDIEVTGTISQATYIDSETSSAIDIVASVTLTRNINSDLSISSTISEPDPQQTRVVGSDLLINSEILLDAPIAEMWVDSGISILARVLVRSGGGVSTTQPYGWGIRIKYLLQ